MSTNAKYQHLIPKTYLSAWITNGQTLEVEFLHKDPGVHHLRNISNIAGVNHHYTITVQMPFCTREDAEKLFEAVSEYVIEYEGRVVSDPCELYRIYYDFDNWRIADNSGNLAKKKKIRDQIEQVKIRDIEENWGKQYESRWNDVRGMIESKVCSISATSIPPFEFRYLIAFYVMLDWRGFNSNELFLDAYQQAAELFLLDQIAIPANEAALPKQRTALDEFRHYYLLNEYRRFLDPVNPSGVMRCMVDEMMAHMNLHFLVAGGTRRFVTCDTPAFYRYTKDGREGVLPISPKILLTIGRRSRDATNFLVDKVDDEVVSEYNEAIRNSATEFVVY